MSTFCKRVRSNPLPKTTGQVAFALELASEGLGMGAWAHPSGLRADALALRDQWMRRHHARLGRRLLHNRLKGDGSCSDSEEREMLARLDQLERMLAEGRGDPLPDAADEAHGDLLGEDEQAVEEELLPEGPEADVDLPDEPDQALVDLPEELDEALVDPPEEPTRDEALVDLPEEPTLEEAFPDLSERKDNNAGGYQHFLKEKQKAKPCVDLPQACRWAAARALWWDKKGAKTKSLCALNEVLKKAQQELLNEAPRNVEGYLIELASRLGESPGPPKPGCSRCRNASGGCPPSCRARRTKRDAALAARAEATGDP